MLNHKTKKIDKITPGQLIRIDVEESVYLINVLSVELRSDRFNPSIWQTFVSFSFHSRKTKAEGEETILAISFLDILKRHGVQIEFSYTVP